MSAAPAPDSDGERRQREVAVRLFASEFNEAKHHVKEEGTYGPSYVVSPFGSKVNRLLAVGVLTSVESVGQTGDRYRAQVVDPTGTFHVYSGQYEPEATAQLADIKPPALVAVVGKSRTYQPDNGVTYVSVRPESISVIGKAERDAWLIETAKHSMIRLEALREAMKLETPTAKTIEELGFPKDVAEGVARAFEHYGKPDLARYASIVKDALETLLPGGAERVMAEPSFAPAAPPAAPTPAVRAPAKPAPAAENPHEPLILSLAEKLDDGKGAPWEDIVAEAAKKNVREDQVEECLNHLMDKGLVYEPVLGRLKLTK